MSPESTAVFRMLRIECSQRKEKYKRMVSLKPVGDGTQEEVIRYVRCC